MTFRTFTAAAVVFLIASPHDVLGQTDVPVNDPTNDSVERSTQATGAVASYAQFVVVAYVDSEGLPTRGTAYSCASGDFARHPASGVVVQAAGRSPSA